MNLRPSYRYWTARQHDLAQRQSADPVGYAYAGSHHVRRANRHSRRLYVTAGLLLIAAMALLR